MAAPLINQQITVDASTLQTVTCSCGKFIFENVFVYKVIPSIYSNTGKPGLFAVQCLKCLECGMIHQVDEILRYLAAPESKIIAASN